MLKDSEQPSQLRSFATFLKMAIRNPLSATRFGKATLLFARDYIRFSRWMARMPQPFDISGLNPQLYDKCYDHSSLLGHYFRQDLYVARRIYERKPLKHVDVGSRIDGFVAHVAAFREIEVLDVRDPGIRVPNIIFQEADIADERFPLADYCDSASSLHVIEHLGLGRYGDRIDPEGHLKGLANMHKLLKSGGLFYFSVPIGPQRIEFNAHRVFSLTHLLNILRDLFAVERFSYEDDCQGFHENVQLTPELIASNAGCQMGCGIFELRKKR